ncbi:hypothetical protein BSI_07090 [Bacillus inaquosorum KCTC 13429]|uniref:Uncharacterized protein n=1 Tax=Bacillus inaquosorum KCTC 13429 TaxID=1236548 RepID=A0A9W5PEV8_9BACI|nr:hypothetical protein BSI_07090 [Bacillus inaquosorum KCTC 13429]
MSKRRLYSLSFRRAADDRGGALPVYKKSAGGENIIKNLTHAE